MEVQSVEQLTKKKCVPCEGGVDACDISTAKTQLKDLVGWRLTHEGQRIRKDWKVRDFMAGMEFLGRCAELAEEEGHHPDVHIEAYRNVSIELWTHAIGGLSDNDFIMAAKIDRLPITLQQ